MNEGTMAFRLGLKGMPAAAEEAMVARDIALLERTGGRLHIAHVSTAGTVDLVRRAKARGLAVTRRGRRRTTSPSPTRRSATTTPTPR